MDYYNQKKHKETGFSAYKHFFRAKAEAANF